jgi:hypothetical protein
LRWL